MSKEIEVPKIEVSRKILRCDNQSIRKYLAKGCWIVSKDKLKAEDYGKEVYADILADAQVVVEGRKDVMASME